MVSDGKLWSGTANYHQLWSVTASDGQLWWSVMIQNNLNVKCFGKNRPSVASQFVLVEITAAAEATTHPCASFVFNIRFEHQDSVSRAFIPLAVHVWSTRVRIGGFAGRRPSFSSTHSCVPGDSWTKSTSEGIRIETQDQFRFQWRRYSLGDWTYTGALTVPNPNPNPDPKPNLRMLNILNYITSLFYLFYNGAFTRIMMLRAYLRLCIFQA